MNGARRYTEVVGSIGRFLAIGARECEPDGLSLDRLMWESLLDRLEDASVGSGIDSLPTEGLSAHTQIMALNHYHRVYVTASGLVPLSLSQWERWKRGLCALCLRPAPLAPSSGADRSSTSTSAVADTRQALLAERDEAFAVSYWGTTWSTEVRLRKIAKECGDRVTGSLAEGKVFNRESRIVAQDNFKGDESHPEDMLARLTRLNFSILQRFSLLRFQSEHLYSVYGAIGVVERSWLLDKLLADREGSTEKYEEAVESMVRQSFKRDFRIPSSGIASGSLLKQYCGFEVDGKKEVELKAVLHDTQKSMEYRIATEFAQHEAAMELARRHGKCDGTEGELPPFMPRPVLDAEGRALADEWVAVFRKSNVSSFEVCQRRAFSFTLRRLIELEEFPGVLNASRLEFCLHLLQRWVPAYCARQHRWTVRDPFVCPDDSDFWEFLLERHEVLLRWALSSPNPSSHYATMMAMSPSATPFVTRLETLRMLAWSLVHVWQSYLRVVRETSAARPKRCAREGVAGECLRRWFREKFIAFFCKAFLNDLYAQFGDGDDSAVHSDVGYGEEVAREVPVHESRLANTGALLILESDLKLLICDLQQSTHECTLSLWYETQRRLEPLLDEIIDFLMAESSASLALDMLRGIMHSAVRILARMQMCLGQFGQQAGGVHTSQDLVCIQKLHAHYKRLTRKASLAQDALLLGAIFDGWTQLGSLRLGVSSERHVGVQGMLLIYSSKPCTGHASTAPCGGFMDICYERRRAMKRLYASLRRDACEAVLSSHPATPSAEIEDDDCIGSRKRRRK